MIIGHIDTLEVKINGTKLPQMTGSIGTRLGRQFYDIFIAASAPLVLPAVGPQGWGDV